MGRKKRKVAEAEAPAAVAASDVKMESPPPAVIGAIPRKPPAGASVAPPASNAPPAATTAATAATGSSTNNSTPSVQIKSATMANNNAEASKLSEEDYLGAAKPSSQYGLHSHAGDLVEDDVYVSEGSLDSEEDEEDEDVDGGGNENGETAASGEKKKNEIELVITTSRMGLMRRGGLSSLLGQPQANRTWVRGDANKDGEGDGTKTEDQTGEDADGVKAEEDEENLDPAQRLALQQRKIEEAKREARAIESSENAGRDPCLFSKRTAFDIRLDQVEERPWDKPEADATDYFNYGMDDADWLEYSEGQLAIRQELTDASKQKRLPDPGIVTVVPRAPKVQGDRVAVRTKKPSEEEKEDEVKKEEEDDDEGGVEMGVELGPLGNKAAKDDTSKTEGDKATKESVPDATAQARNEKVVGGAWGAGASKDSVLLKLIQEQSGGGPGGHNMGGRPHMGGPPHMMGGPRGPPQQFGGPGGPGGPGQWPRDRFQNQFNRQGSGGPGGYHPPPPQQQGFQRGPPPGGPGPGQFHSRGGPGGGQGGGQGPPPQGRYPPQQQQGHWGGGGAPGGGRGFPDQRGGPPPPHRGGPPPNGQGPPHGGGGGWDSRKRPRSEYGGGGEPRGDPRRGRW